jgi:preprotein translocase subunit SecD
VLNLLKTQRFLNYMPLNFLAPKMARYLSGDVITDARNDVDQQKGGYEVTMYMNSQGAAKWKAVTAEASAGG